jgi:type IV pilus assembly protein PilE
MTMKRIAPTRTARISFPNSRTSLARGCRGFKLLEFVAVLLIASTVGVTAVSASYGSADDRRQAQRANAQYALSEIALLQEEYFLHNKRYTRHLDSTGLGLEKTATSGGHYELRVEFPADACPAGYCYVISAIPQGEQAEDECGVLELTSDGAKLPAGCW